MGSLNKVMLIGNLGRDAEMRYTQGGTAVATLNLATTETWKDKAGDKKEKTEWHRIVLWGKAAESLQPYLKKGKSIYVEGSLETRKWERDGHTNYTTEVKAFKVTLLGSAGRDGGQQSRDRGNDRGNDRDGYGDEGFLGGDDSGENDGWKPPF